eukprot:TRINITY_DN14633_c0_g2_i3.p1 TRINITY_DN14633_c0_g2~~TRINITY_DN14633_c0_g2_i3.p1  ORF type:complete len:255 (-),score=72.55 TRINITY_DN14633_c0_g2_i3:43-807(-)
METQKNHQQVSKLISICPQQDILWDHLTAVEHLRLYGECGGVSPDVLPRRIAKLLQLVNMDERTANSITKYYSGGNKRKLSFAIAFIANPKVVLLDEPTGAMDPVTRQGIWNIIRDMKKRSSTAIILITHLIEEAEALSSRIGIMVQGRLQALGTAQHLNDKYVSGYDIVLKTHNTPKHVQDTIKLMSELVPSATLSKEMRGTLYFKVTSRIGSFAALFTALQRHKTNGQILDYSISQVSLEQVFLRFASQQDR